MSNAALLLDKAKQARSIASDKQLSERIGVQRSLVSGWRSGAVPMPDDRIVDLATLAGEEAGYWLVAIRADQSGPKIGPHWRKLIARLSTAALIVLAVAPSLMLIGPASSIM